MALYIEIWRSVTSVSLDDFSLLATLPDTGGAVSFSDTPVVPGGLYIYKCRRHEAVANVYTAFSPLAFALGPWPLGAPSMSTPATGIGSRIGVGVEGVEGQPVKPQNLIDRKTGNMHLDLTAIPHEQLNNIDFDIEDVPGIGIVTGSPATTITPEGISRMLQALLGSPSTATGGGTAPAAPATTPSATGGTLPNSTAYYFKVAYERSDWGWTTASAEFTDTTGAGTGINSISIASPAAQTGATKWRLYASLMTGQEVLIVQNLALGSPYVFADPTLITQHAGDAVPAIAFKVHTYKPGASVAQVPVTITDKDGGSFFAYPGCRGAGLAVNIDKEQNTPLEAVWDMVGLNKIPYATEAAIGTDVAPIDALPGIAGPHVTVSLNGSDPGSKTVNFKYDRKLDPQWVLDGYRGAKTHMVGKSSATGRLDSYFPDETQMIQYFGQLSNVALPYGVLKKINNVSLVLTLTWPVNANGFRNKIIFTFPKCTVTKHDQPIQGPQAIMQTLEFKANYNLGTTTGMQIDVWNTETNGAIIATGTPISAVPVNDMTSYSL